ncbi:copper resistance CopC family protein [Sphaerisporangium perillae]|uniref:copper resistance CopC family protein n=1 Tax=Sphaerisporangium perillae TaxID=2935860 RepID=UPI00200DDB89|nr:copper resistance CopC family protein [Sphaerisporangium perillae]
MRTSPLAAALAFVVAVVLGTAFASPALAHTSLKSSDPKKGATVKSLDSVSLTFTEAVRLPVVLVRDAGGREHHEGKPKTDGPTVTQKVAGPLPSGKYTIAWRVVSDDGHPVEGEIPFTVRAPDASPSPAQSSQASAPSSTEQASPPAASPNATTPTPPAFAPTPVSQESRQTGGIPVWVWIVIFGIAGIGIGMAISLRKKP